MLDVKTLCLGVLTRGDMTGYQIKKHFEGAFSHFFVAGFGSIYPALSSLTDQGLVTCNDIEQTGRPHKKVYRLTAAGEQELVETLGRTPPRHKVRSEFLVLMFFAHMLAPERLREVLNQRERDIEALLAMIDHFDQDCSATASPGESMVAGLGRVTLEAQLQFIRERRHTLETPAEAAHTGT